MGLVGLCLALLVLTIADFVILVGRGVVMDSLLASGKYLELFLNELLRLFHYPPGSVRALLAGTPPLRYCAARFARRTPTWRLQYLVMLLVWLLVILGWFTVAEGACREVHWVSGSGPGRKRIPTKLPAHLAGLVVQSRPRVGRDCVT